MDFSPADEGLKCVYCGMLSELNLTATEIEENDFNYWKDRADEDTHTLNVMLKELRDSLDVQCAVVVLPAIVE